jgi:hypothetical protein
MQFSLFLRSKERVGERSNAGVSPRRRALAPMQLREHRAQIYPPGRRFAGPALPLLRTRRAKKLNLMTLPDGSYLSNIIFYSTIPTPSCCKKQKAYL